MITEASVAFQKLVEGNRRFVSGVRSIESLSSPTKMRELAEKGQRPFAMVLCCADSRAPAEMIFDVGLGDLFVVRVAGNVVARSLIGSLEFAATTFGTRLCVVMGHSSCGAVQAAIRCELEKTPSPTDNIHNILVEIHPAVVETLAAPPPSNGLNSAIWANIRNSKRNLLERSQTLSRLQNEGKLEIRGAFLDISTGQVEFE